MTTYVLGPIYYKEPIDVRVGESFKLEIPVYDGDIETTPPYGSLVDISGGTITGELKINKPDGSSDVTVNAAGATGEKADSDGDGTNDAFRFWVGGSTTAGWTVGLKPEWQVLYEDSNPTVNDKVLIAWGTLNLLAMPADL